MLDLLPQMDALVADPKSDASEQPTYAKNETRAIKPEILQTIVDSVPMKRLAKPEEIGFACAYLSNELSGFTTGATININGGLYYQ